LWSALAVLGIRETRRTLHAHRDGDLNAAALRAHRAIHQPPQQLVGTVGQDQCVNVHLGAMATTLTVQRQAIAIGNIPERTDAF